MPLSLPLTGSPLREMFDVRCLLHPRKLPTFRECVHSARRTFEQATMPIQNVQCVCMRADGTIELVQFGPRGGHRTLWVFGKVA